MVADVVLFNSNYNRDSFLKAVDAYLNRIPYEKPKGISEQIRGKCHVLNFPIVFPNIQDVKDSLIKDIDDNSTTTTTSIADNNTQCDQSDSIIGEVACKRLCLEENADKTGYTCIKISLTLSLIYTLSDASAADGFLKT